MAASQPFSAIIFDCDGVLVDSEILGLEDSVTYLQSHGFSWQAADLIRIFTGYRDDVFRTKLEEAYQDIHGSLPPETLFAGLIEARRRHKDRLQMVPGAKLAIKTVKAPPYEFPVAVASSSRSTYLESKLKRTGLWDHCTPHVYSADRVAHGKPAPDIFLYTADQLKTDPARCLVLEDSTQGVRAGRAAGMTVWGFTGGGHCFEGHGERLVDAGAHAVIKDFTAFQHTLGKAF